MNATTLNKVAELLGTSDKNVVFSAVMQTLMAKGMPVDLAYESVFGQGSFIKFADYAYSALRAI